MDKVQDKRAVRQGQEDEDKRTRTRGQGKVEKDKRTMKKRQGQEDNGQEDKRTMGLELGTRTTTLCFATTTF